MSCTPAAARAGGSADRSALKTCHKRCKSAESSVTGGSLTLTTTGDLQELVQVDATN